MKAAEVAENKAKIRGEIYRTLYLTCLSLTPEECHELACKATDCILAAVLENEKPSQKGEAMGK